MRIHVTLTNHLSGTAGMAQRNLAMILQEMGFVEMGIYNYDDSCDNDRDLHKRCDGIIAGLNPGDTVVLQYPTWNSPRYVNCLLNHIQNYSGVKLIIFVHDIKSLQETMFGGLLPEEVQILNRADLLILPSPKMETVLRMNGLKSKAVLYQTVFDYKTDLILQQHQPLRQMYYTGVLWKFPELKQYRGATKLVHYSGENRFRSDDTCYEFRGFRQ